MDFFQTIRTRRSVREYENQPVSQEHLRLLEEAALRAPSSRSLNPWEFIFVQKKETLSRLSAVKEHGASFLSGASLGIVMAADPQRCDVWVEDSSIACAYLWLAAHSLGLGACWIQIRKRTGANGACSEEQVKEILSLPDSFRVLSILSVGYPARVLAPLKESDLLYGKIHRENYRG